MRKLKFICLAAILFGTALMTQAQIRFRSTDKAEYEQNDLSSLRASFSFSALESNSVQTERGTFSAISMPGTNAGGHVGEPAVPVVNRLIAIPMGAMPRVEITSYSSTDYRLADYGINTLMPRQPALRKDKEPSEVPFVYHEAAYQTRGLVSSPQVKCVVGGMLRGVRIAQLSIEPVSYDPSSNTIRVFNDIEVNVTFDHADLRATEDQLIKTYSPYFEVVYDQLFNGRSLRDIWSQHPDIYRTPVRMMVLTTTEYTQCDAFQQWLTWKRQKGFSVDVHTTQETGTSSRNIQDFLADEYDAGVASGNVPTFLVIIGDRNQVVESDWTDLPQTTSSVTDLYYSIADYDIFPDIYTSRMPVKNTTELAHLVEKILEYEQYTMPDPSYLGNALLIAGADNTFNPRYGQPAIRYAANNYFNTAHGYNNVYTYLTSYNGCYDNLNTGVGFANYTAHGSEYSWQDPTLNVSMLNALTNEDKYFWAMGNCCLSGNWGTQNGFAQTILTAEHKGAFAYIGSSPETYWDFDFYFTVGSYTTQYPPENPTVAGTGRGAYDAMFMDDMYNTVNAIPFVGNLSISSLLYGISDYENDLVYCWEQYHTLGDGSVMPYRAIPSANVVSHAESIQPGASSFTVSAEAGSMVCLSKNGERLGFAMVGNSGTVTLSLSSFTAPGPLQLVVTRPQRQPYMADILVGQVYEVNATADPANAGTITGAGHYGQGSTATLTATANPGYSFLNWTVNDQVVSTEATYSFTVNADTDLVAHFGTLEVQHITIASVLNGSISASTPVAMGGVTVTLTATPADGYEFGHWSVFKSDDFSTTVSVSNNQFTMPNYDVIVAAVFTLSSSGDIQIEIPEGGTTDVATDLPTNTHYDYSLSEQIYTASEIGQGGTITAIAFNNYISFSEMRNIDVYLKQTNKTSFSNAYDWVNLTEDDKVFSGSINFMRQAWTTITFDTPYIYDGTSNLIVAVDDNTGQWANELKFYVYETSGDRSISLYMDENDLDPTQATSIEGEPWNYVNQICFNFLNTVSNEAIAVSPNALEGFEAMAGAQASEAQSFMMLAENLTGDVTLTAPEHFEFCVGQDDTYINNIALTPVDGRVATMVSVRLKANLNFGDYNESLTIAAGNSLQTVSLSGSVTSGVVYAISAAVEPIGTGTVQGAGSYGENATATLTAVPNSGYVFVNWTENNAPVSTEATYSFTVTADRALVAHFEPVPTYHISVAENMVNGSVTCSHSTATEGELVTLQATPATGYEFSEWMVYKSSDLSTQLTVSGNHFTMPAYDVTVLAVFIENVFNGTVTIPQSGSLTQSNVLPAACDINYSVTEQIYTVAEIGHSGTINTIAFRAYPENGYDFTRDIDIYMRHTNMASFGSVNDWVNLDSNDMVFTGEVTFLAEDWTVITLDTPFYYDGTSNLLVGVDDNTGTEDLYYWYWFTSYETTGVITSLFNNADDDLSMSNPDYDETVESSHKNQIRFGISNTASNPYHIISDATVVNGNLAVDADHQYLITATGSLTVNGSLTNTNAAYLILYDGGQLYTTSANVQATFHKSVAASTSDANGWVGLASPMSNPSIENLDANTFDLYAYDEDADKKEWQNYKASSFSLANGHGYLYANSAATDLVMTGTLVSAATVQVPLSYNATYQGLRGYNLVGNPYPHPIAMTQVKVNGVALSECYRFDANGQLVPCTEGYILPGEAFFVKATAVGQVVVFEK